LTLVKREKGGEGNSKKCPREVSGRSEEKKEKETWLNLPPTKKTSALAPSKATRRVSGEKEGKKRESLVEKEKGGKKRGGRSKSPPTRAARGRGWGGEFSSPERTWLLKRT